MKFEYLSYREGFLGKPNQMEKDPNEADAVIVQFGMESSSKYNPGTRTGPRAIIRASHQIEYFDEEYDVDLMDKINIATLVESRVDYNIFNAISKIESIIDNILKQGKFPLILGGEHNLTSGAIKPFINRYEDLVILHFDAHISLKESKGGEGYSNFSLMKEIADHNISKVISLGIRNISKEEMDFINHNKEIFDIYFARDLKNWDIKKIMSSLKNKKIYLTFDLSGFDSSLMQATDMPEPGGFYWQDAMNIIRETSKVGDIVGADIVELAPISYLYSCDILAAKLGYKILSHKFNAKLNP